MDGSRCACNRIRGDYDDHPDKCRACTGCSTGHRCNTCSKWTEKTWDKIERKRLARIQSHRSSPRSVGSGSPVELPPPAKKPCLSPTVPVSGPRVSSVTMVTADMVPFLSSTTTSVSVSASVPISSVLPAAGFPQGLPGHGHGACPALSIAPGVHEPAGSSGQASWTVPHGPEFDHGPVPVPASAGFGPGSGLSRPDFGTWSTATGPSRPARLASQHGLGVHPRILRVSRLGRDMDNTHCREVTRPVTPGSPWPALTASIPVATRPLLGALVCRLLRSRRPLQSPGFAL